MSTERIRRESGDSNADQAVGDLTARAIDGDPKLGDASNSRSQAEKSIAAPCSSWCVSAPPHAQKGKNGNITHLIEAALQLAVCN